MKLTEENEVPQDDTRDPILPLPIIGPGGVPVDQPKPKPPSKP
jgi:hypothetical protein